VNSRQREKSFASLTDAQTFQLTLSTGKQTDGAMFTDPAVTDLLTGRSVHDVARMDDEVTTLLNVTLGAYRHSHDVAVLRARQRRRRAADRQADEHTVDQQAQPARTAPATRPAGTPQPAGRNVRTGKYLAFPPPGVPARTPAAPA
jgi:hypothetical protein